MAYDRNAPIDKDPGRLQARIGKEAFLVTQ